MWMLKAFFNFLIFLVLFKLCSDFYVSCLYNCEGNKECLRICAYQDENCREGKIYLKNFLKGH